MIIKIVHHESSTSHTLSPNTEFSTKLTCQFLFFKYSICALFSKFEICILLCMDVGVLNEWMLVHPLENKIYRGR